MLIKMQFILKILYTNLNIHLFILTDGSESQNILFRESLGYDLRSGLTFLAWAHFVFCMLLNCLIHFIIQALDPVSSWQWPECARWLHSSIGVSRNHKRAHEVQPHSLMERETFSNLAGERKQFCPLRSPSTFFFPPCGNSDTSRFGKRGGFGLLVGCSRSILFMLPCT